MALTADYLDRVYAGVLGKIIGVYLGRPFEGWPHERILRELGEIGYYVNQRLGKGDVVVTDDDISGTLTFVRALEDCGRGREMTAADVGQAWLNYIIENRTILWWGGLGMSTEHTAYHRLKHGIPAPESGSIERNGKVVAEQIGAQIFIDGWGMVAPGDPALAADLAKKAASVSHDGEAIYGAQVIAAMEAQAFVERDLAKLLDVAVSFIPRDSLIYRMIAELRELRLNEPDWRRAFRNLMQAKYGYDKYGGNCHMVPNHGVVILALLWGDDDFQRSLMIANTCGWDTDCNSGNVGCLMGIKNGLAGIDAGPDWRGPVADRILLPTADGGRGITDAATEALHLANMGRALAEEPPAAIKRGACFHFEFPGSVQGFIAERSEDAAEATIENVPFAGAGNRALAIRYHHLASPRAARVATATFLWPDLVQMKGYDMLASPTLYSGQTVRAAVAADRGNASPISVRLFVRIYDQHDQLVRVPGDATRLSAGESADIAFPIPPTNGQPVAQIGLEIAGEKGAHGTAYLDYLTWGGAPNVLLQPPAKDAISSGSMYRRAWVGNAAIIARGEDDFVLVQNEGRGIVSQGTADWRDYRAEAQMRPHLAKSFGLAVRCQGLRRFYALVLENQGVARFIKMDGQETELARAKFSFNNGQSYDLSVQVAGNRIIAGMDGQALFDVVDEGRILPGGGVGLILEEGRMAVGLVKVKGST